MRHKVGLLVGLLIFFALLETAQAQSPVDDQLVVAMNALKGALTECTSQKFFECVSNLKKDGYGVNGTLTQQVNGSVVSTDISVSGKLSSADAQFAFNTESKSEGSFPTQATPPPQFWLTQTFDATPGQKGSGMLSAALGTDPSSPSAGAYGVLVCGNLTVDFKMVFSAKFGGSADQALVGATRDKLKDVMGDVGRALSGSGACKAGVTPQTPASQGPYLLVGYGINGNQENNDYLAGETYNIIVTVEGYQPSPGKGIGQRVKDSLVNPADVKVYFDNVLIGSGQTQSAGIFQFNYTTPDNLPSGRSPHTFKFTASKDGFAPGEKQVTVNIDANIQQTSVSLDAIGGEHLADDTVTISGRVFGVKFGLFQSPVPSAIQVTDEDGGSSGAGVTDANGYFSVAVKLVGTEKSNESGAKTFKVQATPNDQTYRVSTASVSVLVTSKGKIQVTAATDKAVYAANDNVTVSGRITSGGSPEAGTVQLTYERAILSAMPTEADGSYSYSFAPGSIGAGGIIRNLAGGHLVQVDASATGFTSGTNTASSTAKAFFIIQSEGADCIEAEAEVLRVSGNPSAAGYDPAISAFAGSRVPVDVGISNGSKLAQGMSLKTADSDRIALRLPLDGGAEARIAVDAKTQVTIAKYCKDASGRYKLLLRVSNPGSVLVYVDNPGSGPAPLDFRVTTPTAKVTVVHTRYYIAVDDTGATRVVALRGTVGVADAQGANAVGVDAGNQILVGVGASPSTSNEAEFTGEVDPNLVAMLEGSENGSIPQPDTNVTNMTLQAARRFEVAGDTELIPFWLIKSQDLANLNFQITYDPNVIQPAGDITKGDLLDNALFEANPKQSGAVLVGVAQTNALEGTGTILNIPFKAVGKPGDKSPLDLKVTTINNPNGGALTADVIAGHVTIVNPDGSLPASNGLNGAGGSTGLNGAGTPNGGILQGDCDGDGHLTELDALCALEMSTGLRTPRLFLDMDSDKNVTSRDAVLLLQRVVGQ